jgi:hypothetical protein
MELELESMPAEERRDDDVTGVTDDVELSSS